MSGAATSGRARVLLTVSGTAPADIDALVSSGGRPRADWRELARAMDAEVLDIGEARRRCGRPGWLVERLAGSAALLAVACFRARKRYDVVLTDGEQVGLPLALLLSLSRRRPAHVMIVHVMSTRTKTLLYRLLRLGRRIDRMLLYSSWQRRFVIDELGFPQEHAVLSTFMVDTSFWDPATVEAVPGALVSTAGLEHRDYPTLIAAASGLDARVVIAAASPWSRRPDSSAGEALPPNVEVCQLDFLRLRQLYAESAVVVMPLADVAFQAGVTTILEAMSMGKPVVCSRTRGQTDVIAEGETGLYVKPGDPEALRSTVAALLADPAEAERLGAAARTLMKERYDIELYAARIAAVVTDAGRAHTPRGTR